MANPKTVEEAIKVAPYGAQWYKPGSPDGKRVAQNLRKTKDGLIVFGSGQASYKVSPAEAAAFFKAQGLTNCNMPQYMPTTVSKPKTATKPKTPPATKGAPKPKPEPSTPIDPGDGTTYTVKKGDTLSAIAKRYGTTVDALLQANPSITNPNLIKVGQVINIPGKDEDIDDQFDPEGDIFTAKAVQTALDDADFSGYATDWRVRLALAPDAPYLYNSSRPGILQPLQATNGVVFPYTPNISVSYAANYEPINITHSNYKVFQYTNSAVDQVTITCDFTAQDTFEARYLLAVIHFFKSMTKMFYGQDLDPVRGTPPPLCYMFGMGGYQFSAHPLAISGFTYNLPQEVDYIQTTAPMYESLADSSDYLTKIMNVDMTAQAEQDRLGDTCTVGGGPPPPKFLNIPKDMATWVPTKIQLAITCVPIMSRNQMSNYFSLRNYASGQLVKGQTRPGGGMW